jgi:hypothetical protein
MYTLRMLLGYHAQSYILLQDMPCDSSHKCDRWCVHGAAWSSH